MARMGLYLGCSKSGYYEIGKDPRYFEKGMGFAWKYFLCNVHPKLVTQVWGLVLGPGDIVKLKINTQKIVPLTHEEREKIKLWKISRSQKNQR